MTDLNSKYDRLAEQEQVFFKQIGTAELCLIAIFDYVFQYGHLSNKLTVEEIMMAVHQMRWI